MVRQKIFGIVYDAHKVVLSEGSIEAIKILTNE